MIGKGKMYVVVNKELGMSTGKTAAQVAHAVARLDVGVPKTMIVLEGTTEQVHNLDTYLERMNIPHHKYIDEGVNEVNPMSATALAFGMVEDEFIPDFIRDFELYKDYTMNWYETVKMVTILIGMGLGVLWLMSMTL